MPAVLTMETIMKRYQIPIMTVIVVLLCHVNALAQSTTVGIMTLNKGAVKLRRTQIDTLFQKAGEKIPVRNLDEIQTGKNSSVTIKLDAKSDELELYSQSFFKIDSVTPESSLLSMSIGKAKFKIQKGLVPLKRLKNRKKRFTVRTANAIVGVKGTEFVMAAGTDVTSVLTIEGTVDVASVAAPDVEVEVKENQASQIKQASTPTAPVTVPASVRENIVNTDTLNAFKNVQFGEAVPEASIKPEAKKKTPAAEKKEAEKAKQEDKAATKSGGLIKPKSGLPGAAGLLVPGGSSSALLGSSEGGDEQSPEGGNQESDPEQGAGFNASAVDAFEADDTETGAIGDDDTINLDNLDSVEIENIDIDEPEIDIADILDVDAIIEEIEETTDEVAEEVEEIQDEIDEIEEIEDEIEEIQDEILEDQLQEIQIGIRHI